METLLKADTDLLLFLNNIHSPLWDNFFWIFTSTPVWIPFYVAIAYAFVKRHELHGLVILLAVGLVILISDQVASGIMKEMFARPRPSREPALEGLVRLVNGMRGGNFGFVSSHAANSFGLAIFTSLIFRKWYYSLPVFTWAALNSYSRIYMGLHYPGDSLGGLIVGIAGGVFVYWLYKKLSSRYKLALKPHNEIFGNEVLVPVGILVTSVFVIYISAKLFLNVI